MIIGVGNYQFMHMVPAVTAILLIDWNSRVIAANHCWYLFPCTYRIENERSEHLAYP